MVKETAVKASIRIDGYMVVWPPRFSWNGPGSGAAIVPVRIDRTEETHKCRSWPDGKMVWVSYLASDRPMPEESDAMAMLIGRRGKIEETNVRPGDILSTRKACEDRVRKIARDRIADIEAQLKAVIG